MENAYWLGRKRAAMAMARAADGAEARLIHYELAGRYSIKAAEARPVPALRRAPGPDPEPAALHLAEATAALPDTAYYGRLATGAEFLAGRTADADRRAEHLHMARLYRARARDCAPGTVH